MFIDNVCTLPNEEEHLYKAINDFSYDGPRAYYANWLAEQGDEPRSNDVKNTIEAFQRWDVAPLKSLNGSDDWQRMIAVPLLRKFLNGAKQFDRKKMTEFRNLVFSKLRPALSMSYRPEKIDPPLGTSRLWGLPDLPVGQEWPKIKMASNWYDSEDNLPAEGHCAFLGQFSFEDFASTVLGQELPIQGGFSIFTVTEVHELGIIETLFLPWDNQLELVRYQAPSDLVEDKLGDGTNSPKGVHQVFLKEVLSLPDPTDGPFKKVIPNCSWNETYDDFYYEMMEACGENHLGFGGYLRGTTGGDPSPDVNSIRMAVLRTNPDCGVVHFSIPSEDLSTGELGNVKYVWSDWDS